MPNWHDEKDFECFAVFIELVVFINDSPNVFPSRSRDSDTGTKLLIS